ncbi:hypothetical protein BN903_50 [Halorubrum sp. AJ67]|nr:hypothetical protein BN903_50 [Halorubrum sp. AJ67]
MSIRFLPIRFSSWLLVAAARRLPIEPLVEAGQAEAAASGATKVR